MTSAVQGVLCEIEGVLADTLPLRAAALQQALSREGVQHDAGIVRTCVAGSTVSESIDCLIERLGLAMDETARSLLALDAEARFSGLLTGGFSLLPGAAEFVESVRLTATLAVVTRARRDDAGLVLSASGLAESVTFVIASEDVVRAKPDPAAYHSAVERLNRRGISRSRIVALEDGVAGILAAQGAGLRAIGVGHDCPLGGDGRITSVAGQDARSLGILLNAMHQESR